MSNNNSTNSSSPAPPSVSSVSSPNYHSDNYETSMKDEQPMHVVMLLDESGSMQNLKNDLVPSINTFIEKQKITEGEEGKTNPSNDLFSLIKFNDTIRVTYDRVRMDSVPKLTLSDFKPDKGTALFDAIGFVIERYGQEKGTLLVIVTDGEENISRKYKHLNKIKELLNKQKTDNLWTVVYLSNNIDAFNQGGSVGCVAQSSYETQAYTHNIQLESSQIGTFLARECSDAVSRYKSAKGQGGIAFNQ